MAQDTTAEEYRRFAAEEARGKSALYEEFARGIADDTKLLQFLLSLPAEKRQPNLVLASVRFSLGTPDDYARFRELVLGNSDELREVILSHRTQTNEPGRCAELLPALAMLPQPLALLEPGCSAGLCLLLDRYAYDYGGRVLGQGQPVLPCQPDGPVPIPMEVPTVVWRAGIDVEPVDVMDPHEVAWLEALVWPGQAERLERLRTALAAARQNPPRLVRGDAVQLLDHIASESPREATLVIFHSALLPYLSDDERLFFVERVQDLNAVWVANEASGILPRAAGAPEAPGAFSVSVNGSEVALADPHGGWLRWF